MKHRRVVQISWFAIGSSVAITSSGAQGSDPVGAQVLFDQAKKLMAAGNYVEACPKLEESQRLDPGSGTLLNLADCYEHVGKTATAWGKFVEAVSAARAANNSKREHEAHERAKALFPLLSNIRINVAVSDKTPGLEVKRDGAVVGNAQWGTPMPIDPGEHVVSVAAPARIPWETKVKVDQGGHTVVVAVPQLAAAPVAVVAPPQGGNVVPSRSSAGGGVGSDTTQENEGRGLGIQKTLALVAGGIGVAAIALGSVYGLKSMSKRNEADELCPPECGGSSPAATANDQAWTAGNVATAGFIVGGAALAGGVVLWLTAAPSSNSPTTAQVGIGPASVVVRGSW
jgi:hypothetical protein